MSTKRIYIPDVNTGKVFSFKLRIDLNKFKHSLNQNKHTVQIRVYLKLIVKPILMCKFDPSTVLLLLKNGFKKETFEFEFASFCIIAE